MADAIQLLITLFLLIMLIPLGILITSYVLGALGVQKIAQRRGAPALWRAWVPVARQQLLGELSDSMPEKQPFCRKYPWRKWYPIAAAILIGAAALMLLITVALWIVPLFRALLQMPMIGEEAIERLMVRMAPIQMICTMLSLLLSAAQIGYRVLEAFILYPVYCRYMKKGAMAFSICGAIFSIHSFFLFAIRNRMEEPVPPVYTTYTNVR